MQSIFKKVYKVEFSDDKEGLKNFLFSVQSRAWVHISYKNSDIISYVMTS